jgi:calcineurin-like phosphoesterase family protein
MKYRSNQKSNEDLTRRDFLRQAMAASMVFAIPDRAIGHTGRMRKTVRLGMISDLHHDIMHDGLLRMRAFVDAQSETKPDAIIQLGDFAYPNENNREVIDVFNHAHERTFHVIGNHDTDAGHTKQQCLDVWGMDNRYYAREINGIWLLVLDGNDEGSPTYTGGYASYIGEEQRMWLKDQLAALDGPVLVFSHQPLAGTLAVDNAAEIREILRKASDKVLMAINGHSHIDSFLCIDGINYLHINSASYVWVGGAFQHLSYSEDVHERYPWIAYTCPYRDPLFAQLTIDPKTRTMSLAGRRSMWVGPSPAELGAHNDSDPGYNLEIVPQIRDREIIWTSE